MQAARGAEVLEAERDRLLNAVAHLEASNTELQAALAQESDSVLREALGVCTALIVSYLCSLGDLPLTLCVDCDLRRRI